MHLDMKTFEEGERTGGLYLLFYRDGLCAPEPERVGILAEYSLPSSTRSAR